MGVFFICSRLRLLSRDVLVKYECTWLGEEWTASGGRRTVHAERPGALPAERLASPFAVR